MSNNEQWIWLPSELYPNDQKTNYNAFTDKPCKGYAVAEFVKSYEFDETVSSVKLRFSGDTSFRLYYNDEIVATGPACVGGDFIGNDTSRAHYYSFETEIFPNSSILKFRAEVQMIPAQICEFSMGHGGFMLEGIVTFKNGNKKVITTDSSWLTRKLGAYKGVGNFDGRIDPDEYVNAEVTKNIWNTETAPIPPRSECEIFPIGCNVSLDPLEEKEVILDFDRIYAAFLHVKATEYTEAIDTTIYAREIDEEGTAENVTLGNGSDFRGFYIHSVGNIRAVLKNLSDKPAKLIISIISTHYPICDEAKTVTSDDDLNLVLNVCKHTLKICRQTHHLDSPRHCEPLACTGDYYIESMMTPFSFGDMRLAEFDLIRTAAQLERENGKLFHTTYSLIFVRMLYDTYMLTGNTDLLKKCKRGLDLLLSRFETYIGENGLVDNPPDYMFVDWIYIDGYSMHHPPKALGQSCLNMYYFGALEAAERIYAELSLFTEAERCKNRLNNLQKAINSLLFDKEKGIYFEGLNTPTIDRDTDDWTLPPNTHKRYYLKQSNVLATCFGVCDDDIGRRIVDKIMTDEIEGDCQPYFMHYLFDAIYRLGLRNTYTLALAEKWKKPSNDCPKGLVEGFITPEPTYSFDHSHAWGGTPLYSIPKALIGLQITKAGMSEIHLSPSLLGLKHAKTELLTPYGKVTVEMNENSDPKITHPKNITVITD